MLLLLSRCFVAVALLVALLGPLLPGPHSAGAAPAAPTAPPIAARRSGRVGQRVGDARGK